MRDARKEKELREDTKMRKEAIAAADAAEEAALKKVKLKNWENKTQNK